MCIALDDDDDDDVDDDKTPSQMDVAPWCYKWLDWTGLDWIGWKTPGGVSIRAPNGADIKHELCSVA